MYESCRYFPENIKHELYGGSCGSNHTLGKAVVSHAAKEISLYFMVCGTDQTVVSIHIS